MDVPQEQPELLRRIEARREAADVGDEPVAVRVWDEQEELLFYNLAEVQKRRSDVLGLGREGSVGDEVAEDGSVLGEVKHGWESDRKVLREKVVVNFQNSLSPLWEESTDCVFMLLENLSALVDTIQVVVVDGEEFGGSITSDAFSQGQQACERV